MADTTRKTPVTQEEKTVEFARGLKEFSDWGIKNSKVLIRREKAKDYYNGDHLIKQKVRDASLGSYVFNKFAQISRNRTAHIVAKRPRWRFMPVQEGAIFGAEALQDIVGTVLWNKIKWSKKGEESVNEARDAGSSHIKVIIRPDGFPDAIPLKAHELILDPKAGSKEKLRYWGHVYSMSLKDIERIYGKKVEPDMELEAIQTKSMGITRSYNKDASGKAPMAVWKSNKFKEGTEWIPDFIGRATIYEIWTEDKTTEVIPYKEAETIAEHEDIIRKELVSVHPFENHVKHIKAHEEYIATLDPETEGDIILDVTKHIEDHSVYPQTNIRKKYPFGRKIMFTGGDVLLEDKPNPIAAEMKIGISFRDLLIKWDYDHSDGYWGKPGVQDLFDPQDILNHRVNSITQGINRLNHGIRKVTKRVGEKMRGAMEKFSNWVGMTIPVNHPDDVTVDYGPQIPPHVIEERNFVAGFMDVVMDNTDLVGGNLPKGSPAGVTVNQLLSQGMQPINLIVKHYAEALEELARTLMILMIEFVPDSIKFRMVDDKNKYQFVNWEQIKEAMGYYDIHIDIDAMLETSRQEKLEQALKLANGGYYDREAVLNAVDDPDKHEIIQRNGERQLLTQALEQSKEQANNWEGQFRNLAQNFNRMSVEFDKQKIVNQALQKIVGAEINEKIQEVINPNGQEN